MDTFFLHLLEKTAWPMIPPQPGSLFHITFAAAGILCAALAVWKLRRSFGLCRIRILTVCGFILAVSEIYKQMFLYYVVNDRHYDWWYFPFQLCSLPMYLCLLLPVLSRSLRKFLCTFMYSYNLLGAVMTFVDPSGLMHSYWTLTLHGFLWHILLIFIGLLIAFSRTADPSFSGFLSATGIFLISCCIATAINILARPLGNPDMFYISPYYPTTQIFFSGIAEHFGIMAGNIFYILSIIAGAGLLHALYSRTAANRKRPRSGR